MDQRIESQTVLPAACEVDDLDALVAKYDGARAKVTHGFSRRTLWSVAGTTIEGTSRCSSAENPQQRT